VYQKLVLPAALLMLTGCQTTTPSGAIDTSCLAFEPVTYSRRDTPQTVREIRQHNAAFAAICGAPPRKP
jgi:outer membrane biogenesis lipoprotein LolB